jgi:hypothetical protein
LDKQPRSEDDARPPSKSETFANLKSEISNKLKAEISKPKSEISDPKGLVPGSHVRHEKYGRGLVLRREGSGDNVKLTISFPGFGQKKLIEKFAKLDKA